MNELEFDCPLCGEENVKHVEFLTNKQERDLTFECKFCEQELSVTIQTKHIVTWVDAK